MSDPAVAAMSGGSLIFACLGGGIAFALSATIYSFFDKMQSQENDTRLNKEHLARVDAQRHKTMSENRLRSIIATTPEGFWMINPDTFVTVDVNPALCEMLGYTREEMIGSCPLRYADEKNQRIFKEQTSLIRTTANRCYEITLQTRDGREVHTRFNATTLWDNPKDKTPSMAFAFVSNISERKKYEDKLHRYAHYDSITGLPNRRLLTSHLQSMLNSGDSFGLLLFDLDNFKLYNDSVGHAFGDRILKLISGRLSEEVKKSGGLLARLGGDEFVVVSPSSRESTANLASRCIEILSSLPPIDGIDLYVGASVGAVFAPEDGSTPGQLLKNADLAMYEAKARGKGRLFFYHQDMSQCSLKKLEIANRLRRALERHEFQVYYQPQVVPGTGEIVGAEALLRWLPEDGPMVSPAEFIPILEETGLIVQVGKWALSTACRQASTWHKQGHPVRLSVNLSARQFQEADLAGTVTNILNKTGMDASLLCLEITESLLLDNLAQVTKRINALTARGVSFSIDDFGTGYSSLSYLQSLPIKEVKIDKTFVKDLPDNSGNTVIVKTIVAMAKSLGMDTVAEGVETDDQAQCIASMGVNYAQGYKYSRPIPHEDFYSLLQASLSKELATYATDPS